MTIGWYVKAISIDLTNSFGVWQEESISLPQLLGDIETIIEKMFLIDMMPSIIRQKREKSTMSFTYHRGNMMILFVMMMRCDAMRMMTMIITMMMMMWQ
ncbi:MAG: hypothetical protein ACI8RD_003885 [Bacillariaceae sp.]|jgi:hypothetical protein